MRMRQVACERPYERDMHKADKRGRPGLSDVARQGEAVSRASPMTCVRLACEERYKKGTRHAKRHVASLNHGHRSMTGSACGVITHPAHSKPSMLRKSTPSLTALCACLMVAVCARCHHVSFCRTYTLRGRERERRAEARLTALVQYDTPSLLQLPDDWPGAVAGCLDDLDALVDDGLGVSAIVGRV